MVWVPYQDIYKYLALGSIFYLGLRGQNIPAFSFYSHDCNHKAPLLDSRAQLLVWSFVGQESESQYHGLELGLVTPELIRLGAQQAEDVH